jgi:hypothetical protein
MTIDWNPIILAVLALVSTIITVLVPIIVKEVFEAQNARLTKLKAIVEANQAYADWIVLFIQQSMGTLGATAKFQEACRLVDAKLHLPIETTIQLVEAAVGAAKRAGSAEWSKLGGGSKPEPILPPA